MRKSIALIFITIFIILCLVSCRYETDTTSRYSTNPFESEIVIDSQSKVRSIDSPVTFFLGTDWHFGREDRKSGIVRHEKELFEFLDRKTDNGENPYPFMVFLGDLTDYDNRDAEAEYYVNTVLPKYISDNFVYLIGNHEKRRGFTETEWEERWNTKTICKYVYENVSLYKLDNSERVFGKQQLKWLEESLKKDKNPYKIILCHENVTTGKDIDYSTLVFGFADIQERNELYRIATENKVGLILTGHHHIGNIIYQHSRTMGEFNAAALHERDTAVHAEDIGYWYECVLYRGEDENGEEKKGILIKAYNSASGENLVYDYFFPFP